MVTGLANVRASGLPFRAYPGSFTTLFAKGTRNGRSLSKFRPFLGSLNNFYNKPAFLPWFPNASSHTQTVLQLYL